mmetsp:Transcript_119877/g.339799  ORF Transcript_119877/g.339799 Transcript_119877/m.339799 type:complete len:320 (+) Transcript_119877:217-1176(+)
MSMPGLVPNSPAAPACHGERNRPCDGRGEHDGAGHRHRQRIPPAVQRRRVFAEEVVVPGLVEPPEEISENSADEVFKRWRSSWLRPVIIVSYWLWRAEERQRVVRRGVAPHQPHAVVVGVAVHPRALPVHGLHELGVLDRARAALLRVLGRRGAAVGGGLGRVRLPPHAVPLVVDELRAGAVAPHDLVGLGVDGLEVRHHVGGVEVLLGRAVGEGQPGAIDHRAALVAVAVELQLEGECEAVHQADVHVVASFHAASGGVTGRTFTAEGRLELGVNGRGALGVVPVGPHAGLARAAAPTQAAAVAHVVAAHLRPVARGR